MTWAGGNGELALTLALDGHSVVGLDPSDECIVEARAKANRNSENVRFACASFENFEAIEPFDAILFVASLHHMDMEKAIAKAKGLLAPWHGCERSCRAIFRAQPSATACTGATSSRGENLDANSRPHATRDNSIHH